MNRRLLIEIPLTVTLLLSLLGGAYLFLARMLPAQDSPEELQLCHRLLAAIPIAAVVLLAYLVARLLPIRRVLACMQRGVEPGAREYRRAVGLALLLPANFLVGSALVAAGVTLCLLLAKLLIHTREVNVIARHLFVSQGLVILFGMGAYLALRGLLRPVLVQLKPRQVPLRGRFGLRRWLALWLLLLAVAGVMAVLVADSRTAGLLLLETVGRADWRPLYGSNLVAALLAIGFSAVVGWLLGQATSEPALKLRRRLDEMVEAGAETDIARLPVHSTTELGRVAMAFNRLADRLDVENARLEAYAEQIHQTERLRARFLANVSHELRTPLNSIIGYSDVLLQGFDGELDQRQTEAVRIISREGDRFLALINDILMMARFEAGKMGLDDQEFAFSELLEESLSAAAPADTSRLERRIDSRLPSLRLRGDRYKLVRAVSALLEHAFDAAVDSRVALLAEPLEDRRLRLLLSCSHLPPPDAAEAERLFRGFSGAVLGAWSTRRIGLGLALARRIARAHGGEVEFVEVADGCGLQMILAQGGPVPGGNDGPSQV